MFARSNGNSRTTIKGVGTRFGTGEWYRGPFLLFAYLSGHDFFKATPLEGEAHPENPSAIGDLKASSFEFLPDRKAIGKIQGRDDPTRQLRKPPSVFAFSGPKSHIDDRVKQTPRQSRFHIRQWLGIIPPGEAHM